MKCLLCGKLLPESLKECPNCTNKGTTAGTSDTSQRKFVTRKGLRFILYIAAVGAIVVGLLARGVTWGEHNKTRNNARAKVGQAIDALLDGKYELARDKIERAIATDKKFAEAQLTRSMVYLAVGDPQEAERSATTAISLFSNGHLDKGAWLDGATKGNKDRAMLVGVRIQCVAKVAQRSELTREQSGRLFELIYEFSSAKNCDEMKKVLTRWKDESKVSAIATQAHLDCPNLWNCPTQSPAK